MDNNRADTRFKTANAPARAYATIVIPVAARVTYFIYIPIYSGHKTRISNARTLPHAFLVLFDK